MKGIFMNTGTDESLWTAWRLALLAAVAALLLTLSLGTSVASAKKRLLNINTASQAELEAVKGVSPAIAGKIIANRPYKSLKELSKAGLSAKKIRSLESALTAEPAQPVAEKRKRGEPKATTKPGESKTAAPEVNEPVDLNTASLKALEALPGVGRATAKRIIAARPFRSIDDLSKVKGMSRTRVEALKGKVTLAAQKVPPAPSGPAPTAETPSTAPKSTPRAQPAVPAKEKAPAESLLPGQKVDINTASREELDKLPAIGPVKAQAIIDGRPYKKIEDVMKVKGIKQHTFDMIKDHITVK
jgi:competence protein ComEA